MSIVKIETLAERACRIEQIVRDDFFNDGTPAADLALEELIRDAARSDDTVAFIVAMRLSAAP